RAPRADRGGGGVNDSVRVEIERYLDGGMSAEEAAAFLDSVRHDPEALACLGHALEDQAHLFDAIREAAPSGKKSRSRRARVSPPYRPGMNALWIAGLAAAGLFALLLASSTTDPRPKTIAPPRDVAVVPAPPAPPV